MSCRSSAERVWGGQTDVGKKPIYNEFWSTDIVWRGRNTAMFSLVYTLCMNYSRVYLRISRHSVNLCTFIMYRRLPGWIETLYMCYAVATEYYSRVDFHTLRREKQKWRKRRQHSGCWGHRELQHPLVHLLLTSSVSCPFPSLSLSLSSLPAVFLLPFFQKKGTKCCGQIRNIKYILWVNPFLYFLTGVLPSRPQIITFCLFPLCQQEEA